MKKFLLFLFLSITLINFSQVTPVPLPKNYWNINGNLAGANNLFIGPTDNRSLVAKSYTNTIFKGDSIGNFISYGPFSIGNGSSPILNTTNFRFNKAMTGSTAFYGMYYDSQVKSDVTAIAAYYQTSVSTASTAGSYTVGEIDHYSASQGTLGSGSTVTKEVGFLAGNMTASQNYGFWGGVTSGTNKWNLYMTGTASNSLTGTTSFGNKINFSQSQASLAVKGDIYRSFTDEGITICNDNTAYGFTIRNGTVKINMYSDTTVTNPNSQINFTHGGRIGGTGGGASANITFGTNGKMGFGTSNFTPTAVMHIGAGTAQYPAINLTSQTTYTGSTVGAIWRDVSGVNMQVGSSAIIFGERVATLPTIWLGQTSGTTTTNYAVSGGTATTVFNGNTGIDMRGAGANLFVLKNGTTTGAVRSFDFVGQTHTGQTAATNIPQFQLSGEAKQWLVGSIPLQYNTWIKSSNYSATGNSTITTACGLYVEKSTASTSVAIINNFGIGTDGGILASGGFYGTQTNDNATTGYMGEIVSVLVASGSAVTFTTATAMNITTISVTAGDWDVEGNINVNETTATVSERIGGINTTSATLPNDGSEVYCGVQSTVITEKNGISLPRKRISVAGTTTIYLTAKVTFAAGTAVGYGSLTARRVR